MAIVDFTDFQCKKAYAAAHSLCASECLLVCKDF